MQRWSSGKRFARKFKTPMTWQEPRNHHDDCYFYMVKITSINSANREKWSHLTLFSAQWPYTHSNQSPLPVTSFELDNMETEENMNLTLILHQSDKSSVKQLSKGFKSIKRVF